ncbi:MAG: ribonuclease HII [Candidatus Yanofskybacteria bacterium RIFCSPHIGHO2_02_FULL_38_22b]|uniref:Ribonuclease n=1 Tax=Candidatus Yanofskybacteria bacterium RIFCSPHIGHO2_02_FULL_38_22b TaxID=1802673 RepID=A0A1F8F1Z2_9BACT|nr:MAG: ribonuclease HII [Candidatus Yanofskybacteria bacterium RIFCSPHIGHO2_01_FULL_39_44]OGN07162.1 MAG: ribonuclease HII [Candidatus Yanofskybacteria bacterium RIFCSPHIGHO2_02_FULL_38_22b]OGN20012.1 MAG: ribonuclease HII [Candidatus Yanofskybacteria bacterium RIFCSPLOWO2_01_FULL_39_28]
MKLPNKSVERNLFKSGYRLIYAVDEVGMGCLAGPVVVCAVAMTNQFYKKTHKKLKWLKESKLLNAKQRELFSIELLKEKDLVYALAYSYPKTIDKLNIYNAARLAMRRAIIKLTPSVQSSVLNILQRSIVLVDGRTKIKGLNIEQMPIIKGDRKIFAIACASIIAKVFRDKMMVRYAKKYLGYGFEKHKGYGTKYHQTQLIILGPSEIHRKSFAPVAKLL